MVKYDYTLNELSRIVSFMHKISGDSVKVASPRADAVLYLDGEETPFALLLADDGTYYLSLVVSL